MSAKDCDGLQGIVFLVGLFEGFVPFVATVMDWNPTLALPMRLDTPERWIVSGAVLGLAVVALEALERRKKRL